MGCLLVHLDGVVGELSTERGTFISAPTSLAICLGSLNQSWNSLSIFGHISFENASNVVDHLITFMHITPFFCSLAAIPFTV